MEFRSEWTMEEATWRGFGIIRESACCLLCRARHKRHAFGIKLAEEGCPMHYISEVMGHHSIDFTRKHYARFSPDSASRSVLRVLEGRKLRQG